MEQHDDHRGQLQWRTLFSRGHTPTHEMSAGVAVCPPKSGWLCNHHHPDPEIYYVLEGRATVNVGGVAHQLTAGGSIYIPGGVEHGVVNDDPDKPFKWFYVFPTASWDDVKYTFLGDQRAT